MYLRPAPVFPVVFRPVNLSFFFAEVIRQHMESHSLEVGGEEEVQLGVPGM
jgi:hypothetical protein